MNMQVIKDGLTNRFGRTGLQLQKHSPEILLGVGLLGVVTTIVMVAKAARQQVDAEIEVDETLAAVEEDIPSEHAKAYLKVGLIYTKLYGPAASVGTLSILAILASHGVMAKRQVALVAAYNLLNEGFKSYRLRVVEELGEVEDHKFFNGLKDEKYTETETDEEGKKTKVKKNRLVVAKDKQHSIYSRFFDESNPQYRSDRLLNKAFLQAQQNYTNDVLILRGHVFLNEVYERLGFPHTKEGAIVGWVLKNPEAMKEEHRDGYIDFGMYDFDDTPGREFVNLSNPSILLDFNVDGIVYDQI